MNPNSVAKEIVQEVLDYQSRQIQIVPGFFFNQYETINTIFFYYNSRFESGEIDDEGDRKYFLNINKNPCKVCSKAIDFDTKNIRLLTAPGGNTYKTWFMERDLKYWMRDKQFGKILNELFHRLPIYGTVVIKIVEGTPYFVDLRNFIVEQSADSLDSMNYITEIHNLTVPDFRKIAKKLSWPEDKVKEVIEKFRKTNKSSHIILWERYGEVENKDGSYTYKRTFIADVEWDLYDLQGNRIGTERGVEIEAKDWDEHPYFEFHMEKLPGRWLGIGVVETLFEPQIRQNELCNLQTKSSYWAALRVWQSRGVVNKNLKTDVRDGQILDGIESEITQVDMTDRNIAFFSEEYQKWNRNRDELTFSYDVVQGERLPAGTPLGSAQIAISQTLSYFELIQENVALDVKEMLYKAILPQFEKDNTAEHALRLIGQDLDEYAEMVKNDLLNHEIVRLIVTENKFPTEQERNAIATAIEESIKQSKEKILPIPKGFYDDAKYDLDIDITGESLDTRVRYATRFAILQAITADPTVTTDPVKKKILAGIAEDGGLNVADILGTTKTTPESALPPTANLRSGGGVSAPATGMPVPGQVAQTV